MTGEFEGAEKKILGKRGEQYFTTFHYTTDAFRTQDVAKLWKVALASGESCSIWAEGCAARAAACALPLLENVKSAQFEAAALALDGDEAYFKEFFIPGILALGGIEGCLQLAECSVEKF